MSEGKKLWAGCAGNARCSLSSSALFLFKGRGNVRGTKRKAADTYPPSPHQALSPDRRSERGAERPIPPGRRRYLHNEGEQEGEAAGLLLRHVKGRGREKGVRGRGSKELQKLATFYCYTEGLTST